MTPIRGWPSARPSSKARARVARARRSNVNRALQQVPGRFLLRELVHLSSICFRIACASPPQPLPPSSPPGDPQLATGYQLAIIFGGIHSCFAECFASFFPEFKLSERWWAERARTPDVDQTCGALERRRPEHMMIVKI